MTDKPSNARAETRGLPPLPNPPPKGLVPFTHFVLPNVPGTLAIHLKAYPTAPGVTTLVSGYGYICRNRANYAGCPSPNLVVAFDVDCDSIIGANGYVIEEVGKPPDLVLEVASPDNGRREYVRQREMYAGFGIPEFWSYDCSGGAYHAAPLALNLLTSGGAYKTVALTTEPDGVIWGYSEVLGLSVCWVAGSLRFWDHAQQRYLPDQREQAVELADTQDELNLERQACADAEARVRLLEEELRRRDNFQPPAAPEQ